MGLLAALAGRRPTLTSGMLADSALHGSPWTSQCEFANSNGSKRVGVTGGRGGRPRRGWGIAGDGSSAGWRSQRRSYATWMASVSREGERRTLRVHSQRPGRRPLAWARRRGGQLRPCRPRFARGRGRRNGRRRRPTRARFARPFRRLKYIRSDVVPSVPWTKERSGSEPRYHAIDEHEHHAEEEVDADRADHGLLIDDALVNHSATDHERDGEDKQTANHPGHLQRPPARCEFRRSIPARPHPDILLELFGGALLAALKLTEQGRLGVEEASEATASVFLDGARAR